MSKPREFDPREMRDMMLDHLQGIAHYWANLPQSDIGELPPGMSEAKYRAEGVVFSILVMLDGGSVGIPGFDLVAQSHPSDAEYFRDQGENWWPNGHVVEVAHEDWHPHLRETSPKAQQQAVLTRILDGDEESPFDPSDVPDLSDETRAVLLGEE